MGNRGCGIYSSVWQACFSQLGGSTINPESAFKHWTSCTTCNQDLLRLKTFLETRPSFKVLQRTIVPLLISNISNPYYMENNISMDLFIFEILSFCAGGGNGWSGGRGGRPSLGSSTCNEQGSSGCSVACECQSRSTVVFERALVFERTFTSTIAGECVSLFFPQWCLELGERLLPLHKGRFLNKMNLGSIYSTCFFGAVVIRGMNSNYKPKAFFNRRNLVSTCFFRAVGTAVKGDVEYIYRAVSHHQNSFKGW